MGTPLITALIDTYNYGRYIETAVESVLAQDFPRSELEIVVVDDGSTDDTAQRLRRFGNAIRYFYKPNGGQASALNLGFEVARGEIVALLDADDWWLPGKLDRVAQAFGSHEEVGMVYHGLVITPSDGSKPYEASPPPISGFVPHRPDDLLRYSGGPTSVLAFRKRHLGALLPIPESLRISADGYLVYLIIFVAEVLYIRQCLTVYRLHGGNSFNFSTPDEARLCRKLRCQNALVREIKRRLRTLGYDPSAPRIAAYVRRHELFGEKLTFAIEGVGRWELFKHLREEQSLLKSTWTRRYRLFKALSAVAALCLGYRRFQLAKSQYGRWILGKRIRELLAPCHSG